MYYTVGTYIPLGKKKDPEPVHFWAITGTKVMFVKAIESLTHVPVKNSFAL